MKKNFFLVKKRGNSSEEILGQTFFVRTPARKSQIGTKMSVPTRIAKRKRPCQLTNVTVMLWVEDILGKGRNGRSGRNLRYGNGVTSSNGWHYLHWVGRLVFWPNYFLIP